MRIIWTVEARTDVDEIYDLIAEDNPTAADEVYDFIYQYTVQQLSDQPHLVHDGKVQDTRELAIPRYRRQYIVVHQPTDRHIQIVAVWHGKRRWLMSFDPPR